MDNSIDIKKLNLQELSGVVNIYPWYGAARVELCGRVGKDAEESVGRFSELSMYVSDRRVLAALVRRISDHKGDWSDKSLKDILEKRAGEPSAQRKAGGDFFSTDEYDDVSSPSDEVFSHLAVAKEPEKGERKERKEAADLGFYTETLAQIYADQGYYNEARLIYSKLLLAYPEKSTYFATLIDRIDGLQ